MAIDSPTINQPASKPRVLHRRSCSLTAVDHFRRAARLHPPHAPRGRGRRQVERLSIDAVRELRHSNLLAVGSRRPIRAGSCVPLLG